MILNTGSRTDIPAFYSEWFYNRIRENYVLVKSPYAPSVITRYCLSPDVIDCLVFCTKNPQPMLRNLSLLSSYGMYWFVTITPYGKEVEPFVPQKEDVLASFRLLAREVGPQNIGWRYDPIFVTKKYSMDFHIRAFRRMADYLQGYTHQCTVSFIDLYEKTKRNFPGIQSVPYSQQEEMIDAFEDIAKETGMQIHLCCEDASLTRPHIDADGCLSQKVIEHAIGQRLLIPGRSFARDACKCLLGADIGAYNTCLHGCKYCYANFDRNTVLKNYRQHDPSSPLLIGRPQKGDIIRDANQSSWKDLQINLFDLA